MNNNQKAKRLVVEEIQHKIQKSKAIVVAEFAGITVKELQELRKQLKPHGVELKVYKNRLFKIAAANAGFKELETSLANANIYAFGMTDEIAPAKILAEFAKTNKALVLKSGTYEGKVLSHKELMTVATLPSYEEALAMLANSLISPIKFIGSGLHMLVKENKVGAA